MLLPSSHASSLSSTSHSPPFLHQQHAALISGPTPPLPLNYSPPQSLDFSISSHATPVKRCWRRRGARFPPPPPPHSVSKLSTTRGRSLMEAAAVSGDGLAAAATHGVGMMERFLEVGNEVADAAGVVIRKYFRKSFDILDKADLSPVTIADREAEESMVSIILESFPSHAIFGEENGWRCSEKSAGYVWVLDPIDGTKSFITGKPLFGTLIALLHKGKPILGIIDQPVLRERWVGVAGRRTTLNGKEVSTRPCSKISQAYLYTTSPHLFDGDAEKAFGRVRSKVKVPLYGCDCYAYALLASGFVDLVIESGLKPYDFLSLVPVIEGAGGLITDWKGQKLHWEASSECRATSFNVAASGDSQLHQEALDLLQWH